MSVLPKREMLSPVLTSRVLLPGAERDREDPARVWREGEDNCWGSIPLVGIGSCCACPVLTQCCQVVGYPNVGKSSLINSLLRTKAAQVLSQPRCLARGR